MVRFMPISATRLVAALASSLAAVVLSPLPSSAAVPTGSTAGSNVVLYDGCHMWPLSYTLSLPPQAVDWSLDMSVRTPGGLEVTSAYAYGSGSTASGTEEMQFCGSLERPGRHAVEASGEWCDTDYDCFPFTLPTSSFSVRQAKTRTTLEVSDSTLRENQVFTFYVRTKDEQPNGFFAADYADVVIQRKVKGKWVKAPDGDIFISNGKGKISYRWLGGGTSKARAVRKSSDNLGKSVSRVVTLRNA
jgi:hypothetical protein